MKYNFDIEMGAKISAQVVEKMVIDLVEQQVGKKVGTLEATTNDGKFNGYSVTFSNEQVAASVGNFKPVEYKRIK